MPISFKSPEAFARTAGVSAETVGKFKQIAGWIAAAASVYGSASAVLAIVDMLLPKHDPVLEAIDRIEKELKGVTDQSHANALSQRLHEAGLQQGTLKSIGDSVQSFYDTRAEQHRQELVGKLTLRDLLLGWTHDETNQMPFYPSSYQMLSGESTPPWMASGGAWVITSGEQIIGAPPSLFGGSLPPSEYLLASPTGIGSVQALRAAGIPSHNWLSPKGLTANEMRWDGRISYPLLMLGTALYLQMVQVLEPYYRTTGHESANIRGVAAALTGFADMWDSQLLVSADMPIPTFVSNKKNPLLGGGEEILPNFTFSRWPCGAADPVFGTSQYEDAWWTPGLPVLGRGLMGQDQLAEFAKERQAAIDGVRRDNGLHALRMAIDNLSQLLLPPWESESLKVHDESAQAETKRMLSSTPATAETFDITVRPTTFQGVREAREVAVRVPIAVQANPGLADAPNVRRLAMSDVTFGYKIDLIDKDNNRINVFEHTLRQLPGQPGLWHTAEPGLAGLRPVPRSTESRLITLETGTYLRYADPTGRLDRTEEAGTGTVRVHCQVRVSDMANDPIPGLTDTWPPHGVLWLELRSDDASNPSFTIPFEVTETTNVGPDGNPTSNEKNRVTYTSSGCAYLEAHVAVFQPAYFEQYEQEKEAFYKMIKAANERFVQSTTFGRVGHLGPPQELIDPQGPLRGTDQFDGILQLLDDPVWADAVVAEVGRTNGDQGEVGAEAIRRGIARLADGQVMAAAVEASRIGQRVTTALEG